MKLGNGDVEGARKVYGSVMAFAFIFTVIVAVIALLNVESLLKALGATPEILPSAKAYAVPFLIFFPFSVVGFIAYFFTNVSEKPFPASLSLIIGAILAMVLEYIAIFILKWGIVGSAISFISGLAVTVFLIPYLQFSNSPFKLKTSDIKIDFSIIKETLKIGFAMFIIQISTIVSTIIINNLIIQKGGSELHIAAFGIINAHIAYVLTILTTAFITGILPIASFNIGAKSYHRVASLVKIAIAQSTIAIIAITILVFTFAAPIIAFFVGPNPELIQATSETMKIFLLLYALGSVTQIVSGYYMAVEKSGLAILNGLARGIIFAVPLLIILPHFFGLRGVWMAQPGADALSFILALICIMGETKRLKRLENERL